MDTAVTVKLKGDLGRPGMIPEITRILAEACDSGAAAIAVDLEDVTSVSYDAVVAILSEKNSGENPRMRLVNIPDHLARIIETFHIPV